MIGISTYAFTWAIGVPGYKRPENPMTLKSFIETANRMQYSLVQIGDNVDLLQLDRPQLLEIKQLLEKHKMQVEIATRDTNKDVLLAYLDLANFFQAKLVRTLITTKELSDAAIDLKAVLPSYKSYDVDLAIENHGLHTTEQLVQLIQQLNHPKLGVCLDTVNSFGALESPEKVIRDLLPYTTNLHFKDFDISRVKHQMGYEILGAPAGKGRLDISYLMDQLQLNQKNISIILELWVPFEETVEKTIQTELEWVIESTTFLQQLMSEK